MRPTTASVRLYAAVALSLPSQAYAAEHHGQLRFNGLAVPGAAVVLTQGTKHFETTTDSDGLYNFAEIPDGRWTLRVESPGFASQNIDLEVTAGAAPESLALRMLAPDQVLALAGKRTAEASSAVTIGGNSASQPRFANTTRCCFQEYLS